jgi:hypothetical protein
LLPSLAPELGTYVLPGNPVVMPLAFACLAIVVFVPVAAARGKLHIPGYVGIAFLSFALAMIVGYFSGARGISTTPIGHGLAVGFFLFLAVTAGCLLALLFYRRSGS